VFGGAVGADLIALDEAVSGVLGAQAICPDQPQAKIRLIVVVAAKIEDQPEPSRAYLANVRAFPFVEIIELGLPYDAQSLKYRNHVMIDRAPGGKLLAYWNGQYRSGTYSAICYAKKKGLVIDFIGETHLPE
jgi:hypothetical protein